MEFAYSLSMYSPPVRVRPANARKSSSTNTNTNTNTYTFVHGANRHHTDNRPQEEFETATVSEDRDKERDNTSIEEEEEEEEHQHQPRTKKVKKHKKSSDASSVRSRIPGKRRPPPAGTLPQGLAHRPASHHSQSRTSSSFSASSRTSHETQAQAQAQAQASVLALAQTQTRTQQLSTNAHAHATAVGTTSGTLISSPPATSSSGTGGRNPRPNNGRGANTITTYSPAIDSSDANVSARDSTTVASASAPPIAVASASIASASSPSAHTTLPTSDSERLPASPKSSKFIRSVHIPIFSADSGYQHHTINIPSQNRLHKRDSLHYHSSNYIPQRPPTPTSPIQTIAGLSSPVRRRSSRGKHHHDAMPVEPGQFNPSQKYAPASYRADSVSSASGPAHTNRPGIMTSNETLIPSSAEGSVAPSSTSTSTKPGSIATKPFIIRNNRTYIHEPTLLYPLPVDLAELHRQSLRTLMLFQLFGGPTTAPEFSNKPPSRVLELGCGSAFWSMMCHRYFAQHGHSSISFTGLDIVPLVGSGLDQNWKPDKDMRWRFLQHDMREMPWPLADNEFDLIMVKDMSLSNSMRNPQKLFEEYLRILKPGGVIEFWESDHTIRMLRPHVLKAPAVAKPDSDSDSDDSDEEEDNAGKLGAYPMTNNTPLSAPLNPFLVEYNGWATKALDARGLSPVPCTLIGPHLLQEAETLIDVRSKRLAVPLSEIRWEREGVGGVVTKDGKSYIDSMKGKAKAADTRSEKPRGKALSAGQAALRRTALESVVGMILCFEPILKEVSGKSQDEWDNWSGKMMNDLLREGGTSWGECLEVGAWCARKKLDTTT